MVIVIGILVALVLIVYVFMQQPSFGRKPAGERLQRVLHSPHYRDGKFQNQSLTPDLTEGATFYSVIKEFFFSDSKDRKPPVKIPAVKTDLHTLPADENVLVWFGHSSYYMQIDGKKMLVDPVLSGSASPVSFTTRSFPGSDIYTAADIPAIDYLFISHDHWDHMDHKTLVQLRPRIGKVITGLGTGAHLERWGYAKEMITEKDWNETIDLGEGFVVHTTPARHFSGRGFKRQQALWMSFVLQTPSLRIFIGGDSGYDKHFAAIGEQYGPFDLAILECGQYNKSWKYIHMMPEELVAAAQELKTKQLLPVHWAKFSLATHSWDDSIKRVTTAAQQAGVPLMHPQIGQKVYLDKENVFTPWWATLK